MEPRVFGAVDIGASGGRVMAGVVEDANGTPTLHTVRRFANGMVRRDGHLRWDLTRLIEEVLTGLTDLAREFPQVESIGIDTWAVDYALLDSDLRLLAEPISYRDERGASEVSGVHSRVTAEELYDINGLQHLPFTTLFQLAAEKRSSLWDKAAHIVLLPDLIAYRLSGVLRTEATNASTTGLLDARTGVWSEPLMRRLGLPMGRLAPLVSPGDTLGQITRDVAARTGMRPGTVVTAVGSHDTASAVVAVPAATPHFAYVSSGTWSLAGLELDKPVLTPESRAANFTNEGGVDGRIRYLRNIGGLWLLQESLRTWPERGVTVDQESVLRQAEELPSGGPVVDVDDESFIAPGDIPSRITQAAGTPDMSPAETVRCILDSLAAAYARTINQAARLAERTVEVIHIVGGGSRNALLCQLTAHLAGIPVTGGPIEATALGNILVQARAHGAAPGSLEEMRAQLSRTGLAAGVVKVYLPDGTLST
ncbi:rhamnulokinase family protein [Intrasporangium sp.]|uniref:rhamnulokinase n=1 Tax=Intrasporangium sp. TaxID=1925024 RepID=UPI0033659176